jgi:hypothetical protein
MEMGEVRESQSNVSKSPSKQEACRSTDKQNMSLARVLNKDVTDINTVMMCSADE